jgi:hypothetical protein
MRLGIAGRGDLLPNPQGRCGEAIGFRRDSEPDTIGARGDVMSAKTIEEFGPQFPAPLPQVRQQARLGGSGCRAGGVMDSEGSYSAPGVEIQAKSWLVGVKVFADHIRQKVLTKEYQSFSIGGRGVRVPRTRFIPRSRTT